MSDLNDFPYTYHVRRQATYLALPAGLAIHRFARFVAHAAGWQSLNAHLWASDSHRMDSRHVRGVHVVVYGDAHFASWLKKALKNGRAVRKGLRLERGRARVGEKSVPSTR